MNTPRPRLGFDRVDRVVAEPLRFKAKLAIGENAYTSLRTVNRLREVWDVLGAAGAGAALAKGGLLGIGAASTPIGWVALAAVASGGACYGLYRVLAHSKGNRVIEIPRCLNTPLDTLGLALFDLLAPMALRLAAVDGSVSAAERLALQGHLVDDWGLDATFVAEGLALVEPVAVDGDLAAMADEAAAFLHANPDCNHAAMADDYLGFLRQLLVVDGPLGDEEAAALAVLAERLKAAPAGPLHQQLEQVRQQAAAWGGRVKDQASEAAAWAQAQLPAPAEVAATATRVQQRAQQVGEEALRAGQEAGGKAIDLAQDALRQATPVVQAAARQVEAGVERLQDQVGKPLIARARSLLDRLPALAKADKSGDPGDPGKPPKPSTPDER